MKLSTHSSLSRPAGFRGLICLMTLSLYSAIPVPSTLAASRITLHSGSPSTNQTVPSSGIFRFTVPSAGDPRSPTNPPPPYVPSKPFQPTNSGLAFPKLPSIPTPTNLTAGAGDPRTSPTNGTAAPGGIWPFVLTNAPSTPRIGVTYPALTNLIGQPTTQPRGDTIPVSVGGRVFIDINDNGTFEPELGETGFAGAIAYLLLDSGDGVPDAGDPWTGLQVTSDSEGRYRFSGLAAGNYWISLSGYEFLGGFPLFGWSSSLGTTPAPDPDNDVAGDDNGTPINISGWPKPDIITSVIHLSPGNEPTSDGDDANSNLTVDFGVTSPPGLGGTIFNDLNNDGVHQPQLGESPLNGVDVALYRDNGNGIPDAQDSLVQATQANSGSYLFALIPDGAYWVGLPGSQFSVVGRWRGWQSSLGDAAAPDPDNDVDGDDNGSPASITGATAPDIVTGVLVFNAGSEPVSDGDGAKVNRTIDFGLTSPSAVTLGGTVFQDLNNNSHFDPEQGEKGMLGVLIRLHADSGDGIPSWDDPGIGQTLTDLNGHYEFEGLVPGDYWASFDQRAFEPGQALYGWQSSGGESPAPDPDNDVDNDDNGFHGYFAGFHIESNLISLHPDQEPTNDGNGPSANDTLDFGLVAPRWMSLGGQVFEDLDNDGQFEPEQGEAGVQGVGVYLFLDNGNGTPDSGDSLIDSVNTQASGTYLFATLREGHYWISLSGVQFSGGQFFAGWSSSLGATPAPDPDNDTDHDDNGTPANISGWPAPDIISGIIDLSFGSEPTTDGDGSDGNLTLDFGLLRPRRVHLGGLVFNDLDNDGRFEPESGETGIQGAVVRLFRDRGDGVPDSQDPAITGLMTDFEGRYAFRELEEGDYWVSIPGDRFLAGNSLYQWTSSLGNTPAPDPNNDLPRDDNGTPVQISGWPAPDVVTGVIQLRYHSEPTTDGDDSDGNLTLDLGLVGPRYVSLGGRVFRDADDDGQFEPDAGETGFGGVIVYLLRDRGNGSPDPYDDYLSNTTTAQDGSYSFTGLSSGDYWVSISGYEFLPGYPLQGWNSSLGTTPAPDPDNDVAFDDNGTPINVSGFTTSDVITGLISLAPGTEPTHDGDGADSNRTLDFGLVFGTGQTRTVALGGRVFRDNDDDGQFEPDAGETGFGGVIVYLLRDRGNGVPDPYDDYLFNATTGSDGSYAFTGLSSGDYWVSISGYEFLPGYPLQGWTSSLGTTPAPDPDNDVAFDDNGTPINVSGFTTPDVITSLISLRPGTEPTHDGDGADSNRTLDFGLVSGTGQTRPVALGGRVFRDNDNDGQFEPDSGETGFSGVIVYLLKDRGNGVPDPYDDYLVNATTAQDGSYTFTGLTSGDYWVSISGYEFLPGYLLQGWTSSLGTTPAPDPDNDVAFDDNGTPINVSGFTTPDVITGLISLAPGTEPTHDGDGADSNRTLDFGLFFGTSQTRTAALGGRVFRDNDDDGQFEPDSGENGMGGILVSLFRDRGNGVPDPHDEFVAKIATADGGSYSFTGLTSGDYWVSISGDQFLPGATLYESISSLGETPAPDPDNDVALDDNGTPAYFSGFTTPDVITGLISLDAGTEPTHDGDGADGNRTLDFGLAERHLVSLGGHVFHDLDDDGLFEPEAGEAGLDGVGVYLLLDNGNGVPDASDPLVTKQTTAGGGIFSFDDLPDGTYWVSLSGVQFQRATRWWGWTSSLGSTPAPDPNNDVARDDNGTPALISGWPAPDIISGIIQLHHGTEPISDGDGPNQNRTLDFGLIAPRFVELSGTIFRDTDDDGLFEPQGGELGFPDVLIQLMKDNGNGVPDANDELLGGGLADDYGYFRAVDLLEGDYWILVPGDQFGPNKDLSGWTSSLDTAPAPDPNNDVDNDDNGSLAYLSGSEKPDIVTGVLRLRQGTEPTNDGDGPNQNRTLDIGLARRRAGLDFLGGTVFRDSNNNGTFEPGLGEVGLPAIHVYLLKDSGNQQPDASDPLVADRLTDSDGSYVFPYLADGDYWVSISGFQFSPWGDLVGWTSSLHPTPPPDPDNDVDHDDNGNVVNISGWPAPDVITGIIQLRAGTEPTNDGDDANGNLTLDFGLLAPNQPPVAEPDRFTRPPAKAIKIPIATLLQNDRDPDGGPLEFLSFAPTSEFGGTVQRIAAGWLSYAPGRNDNIDSFVYTIRDSRGAESSSRVELRAEGYSEPTPNILDVARVGTLVRVRFAGIPQRTYSVQVSSTLNPAQWSTLGSATVGADGSAVFEDSDPPQATRYYRTASP